MDGRRGSQRLAWTHTEGPRVGKTSASYATRQLPRATFCSCIPQLVNSTQFREPPGPDGHDDQCPDASEDDGGTAPSHCAVSPDSNSPSSLLAPMKTMLTALTRPRIASGVASWTSAERTKTLTMSEAPAATRAASESAKLRESPKTTVATPKIATHASILRAGAASRWDGARAGRR